MKGSVIAVLLATLTIASVVCYGLARHQHVPKARTAIWRAVAHTESNTGDPFSAVGAASSDGNVAQLRALFAKGASANYMYENGGQPLMLAVVGGHINAVRFLIAHGANLYGRDNGGNTALDTAEVQKRYATDPILRAKYDTVIAALVNAGAEAEDKVVLEAARQGDTARLQKFIVKYVRINFPLGNPLVLAAQGVHVEAVRVLLKTGSAPYFRPDPNGATVLDDTEVWERRAPDPVTRAKYAQIITLLKKAGALEAWQRAELKAVDKDDVVGLGLLFAHGASADFVEDGQTPLMYAAEDAHAEAVQFLLTHGADVNAEDDRGRTSLDIAAFWAKSRPDPILRAKYAQTIALLVKAGGKRGIDLPRIP